MKNKIISIVVFILLAYILPLSGNIRLVLSVQIAFLALLSVILFVTQPAISIHESKREKSKDLFSVWVILLACLFSQIFSVIEWAYFGVRYVHFSFDLGSILGLLLVISGVTFRIWAIQTLGKYFTATVQTQENQKVISKGAYGIIRHPSYLGAYLAIIGGAAFLHAYLGIIFSMIVMFIAYYYRIKVEEEALVNEFGDEYKNYQQRTNIVVPFIW